MKFINNNNRFNIVVLPTYFLINKWIKLGQEYRSHSISLTRIVNVQNLLIILTDTICAA